MIYLILGWLVFVTSVTGLIVRPWKSAAARAPLPVGLGVALGIWVLWTGAQTYADLIDEGLWTGATLTIVYVPLKACVYVLLGYYLGRAFQSTARHKWRVAAVLSVVIAYALVTDTIAVREASRQRTARSLELTPEHIAGLERRVVLGKASPDEKYLFLENPLCPPPLLADMATSADQRTRVAVARNPALDPALVTKLAGDTDGEVRTFIAHHKALPLSQLQRLARDPYDRVREAVAWKADLPDEDFNRLIDDPSPNVRATIVLQPRLSDASLRQLLGDADERVRRAAQRIAAQRGVAIE
jgi:hypothetical protein